MADINFECTVMLDNDHSKWRTITVKANNEESAKAKLDKRMKKLCSVYELHTIKQV